MGEAGIVVGVDGSAPSRSALRLAASEARAHGTSLTVVMVGRSEPPLGVTVGRSGEGMSGLAPFLSGPAAVVAARLGPPLQVRPGSRLGRLVAAELGERRGIVVALEQWEGDAATVLVDRSSNAQMLVVGARGGGGFPGLRVGSVAQRVLHRGRCPVTFVVRRWPAGARGHGGDPVVVGVSPAMTWSGSIDPTLAFGAREAARHGVGLRILTVLREASRPPQVVASVTLVGSDGSGREDPIVGAAVEAIRAQVAPVVTREHPPRVELVVVRGGVARALVDASRQASMVVVGSGRREFGMLEPGSVGQQVVGHAEAPVAVVRPLRAVPPRELAEATVRGPGR